MQKNSWVRKLRLISETMMSSTGTLLVTKYILSNNSRSKGNQTMEFGQSIKHKITNSFLKKPYTKFGGKTSSRPFLNISLD